MMAGESYVVDVSLEKIVLRLVYEVATSRWTDFESRSYNKLLDPVKDELVLDPDTLARELSPEVIKRKRLFLFPCPWTLT